MQIDQDEEIQQKHFFASCFQLVWQSYSRLTVLVVTRSLQNIIYQNSKENLPPYF